jgi:hypothetical protein
MIYKFNNRYIDLTQIEEITPMNEIGEFLLYFKGGRFYKCFNKNLGAGDYILKEFTDAGHLIINRESLINAWTKTENTEDDVTVDDFVFGLVDWLESQAELVKINSLPAPWDKDPQIFQHICEAKIETYKTVLHMVKQFDQ